MEVQRAWDQAMALLVSSDGPEVSCITPPPPPALPPNTRRQHALQSAPIMDGLVDATALSV